MARPEVTGRKVIADPAQAAFTIAEFARAHRLSVSMYYKLKAQGLAPVEMAVGKRRMISFEAAERWRREREGAATENAA